MEIIKRFARRLRRGEKGFTLIEMLIVVAILGVLSAVAIPSVGNFVNSGKQKAYDTELHSVEMAAMAMLVDSKDGTINNNNGGVATNDLHQFSTDKSGGGTIYLSDYITGLNPDYTTKTGCKYAITSAGVVTQTPPAN